MLKKSIICTLAIILLSLCCTISLANEKGDYINLGNEIMRSIDKTGDSIQNVISGNVVKDAGNMVNNGVNMVSNGINDVGNTVDSTVNNMDNRNDMNNNNENRRNDNENKLVTGTNGDYNATRTSTAQTLNNGINTMNATTWMWIILVVAAVTIMFAIWYYAIQGNK